PSSTHPTSHRPAADGVLLRTSMAGILIVEHSTTDSTVPELSRNLQNLGVRIETGTTARAIVIDAVEAQSDDSNAHSASQDWFDRVNAGRNVPAFAVLGSGSPRRSPPSEPP